MARRNLRLLTSSALFLALAGGSLATVHAPASAAPEAAQLAAPVSRLPSGWTARPEVHPRTLLRKELALPMSDGLVLRGDLILPADASGKVADPNGNGLADDRFPVIVTITAYNKAVLNSIPLGGAGPAYLVKRGYAYLTVDARGTGSSPGVWQAFSPRENKDAGEIIEWAHVQPWSNGNIGMTGPSYMGISQLFAAQNQPAGLKAIFPQVPAADVYRDVAASGGQLDVGFVPFWLGIVGVTGLFPTVTATDPQAGLRSALDHVFSILGFSGPLMLDAFLGGEKAYDSQWYRDRSPIERIDKVKVPAFFIAGEHDLFQRGTPLDFEALQQNGVDTKMILGPWDHLVGSSGAEVGDAGYGSLAELQLRWFDKYVGGVSDPYLDSDIPPLTYYEQGTGAWRTSQQWIGNQHSATTYHLSGTSVTAGAKGALTTGPVTAGTSSVLPIPVAGLCTRSATQWTAGAPNLLWPTNPCNSDNKLNDSSGVVFETPALTEPLAIQGPINARLYVSSNSGDGMLSVSVSDVAPNGRVSRLTGGWQVISHRALDGDRSRYLDGQLIQPYHPFTKAAQARLPRGQVAPVDVEVFPTGARILPGHKLRLAVQAFDTPHLLSPLTSLLSQLTVIKIHNSAAYPSALTLPSVTAGAPAPRAAIAPREPTTTSDARATGGAGPAALFVALGVTLGWAAGVVR